MKQTIQKITIKNPCHEDWHRMAASGDGRFCSSCQKTVVDFTQLSNDQILNYLAGKNHLCGRFGEVQLNGFNRYISATRSSGFSWKPLTLAVAMFSFLPFAEAQQRAKALTESHPVKARRHIKHKHINDHHKNTDSLICKSPSLEEIKIEPELSSIVLDRGLPANEQPLMALGGGISVAYSFPRSLWYEIKWKIKSIFAR